MGKYLDLDAAVADVEPIRWRLKDRAGTVHEYEIPGDPPIGGVLRIIAEGRSNDPMAATEILRELVGEEQLDLMIERGIGGRQFAFLIKEIMTAIGFNDAGVATLVDEDDAGNGSRSPTSLGVGEL